MKRGREDSAGSAPKRPSGPREMAEASNGVGHPAPQVQEAEGGYRYEPRRAQPNMSQAQMASYQRLTTEDALSYLKAVKDMFTNDKKSYDHFLDCMKDFKAQRIDTDGVIARVKQLFRGHRQLILGFNTFLPKGYEITMPPEEPKKTAVEFDQAITYVNKIKARFAHDEKVYKSFLEILNLYRRAQKSIDEVYSEVAILFKDEEDLLQQFIHFLPPEHSQNPVPPMFGRPAGPPSARFPPVGSGQGRPLQGMDGASKQRGGIPDASSAGEATAEVSTDRGGRVEKDETRPSDKGKDKDRGREKDKERRTGEDRAPVAERGVKKEEGEDPSRDDEGDHDMDARPSKRSSGRHGAGFSGKDGQGIAAGGAAGPLARGSSDDRRPPGRGPSSYKDPDRPKKEGVVKKEEPEGSFEGAARDDEAAAGASDGPAAGAPGGRGRSPFDDMPPYRRSFDREAERGERGPESEQRNRDGGREKAQVGIMAGARAGARDAAKEKEKPMIKPISELDLSNMQRCTPSYRQLPKGYTKSISTHRTELGSKVLNDDWVSVTSGSEDYSFKHMRKNQYEESLFRCEDDRFELDMLLESTAVTKKRIHDIVESLKPDKDREPGLVPQTTRVDELNAINYRCVERIYGDHGIDMQELMKKNPNVALPVILHRLNQKHEEWKKCQVDMNKVWAEVYAKNYDKSLDHRSFYFKQHDKKSLSAKALVAEVRELNEKRKHADTSTLLAYVSGHHRPLVPDLTFTFEDPSIHEEVRTILKFSAEEICNGSIGESDKLMKLWANHVEPFLGVAQTEGIQDAEDRENVLEPSASALLVQVTIAEEEGQESASSASKDVVPDTGPKDEVMEEASKEALRKPADVDGMIAFKGGNNEGAEEGVKEGAKEGNKEAAKEAAKEGSKVDKEPLGDLSGRTSDMGEAKGKAQGKEKTPPVDGEQQNNEREAKQQEGGVAVAATAPSAENNGGRGGAQDGKAPEASGSEAALVPKDDAAVQGSAAEPMAFEPSPPSDEPSPIPRDANASAAAEGIDDSAAASEPSPPEPRPDVPPPVPPSPPTREEGELSPSPEQDAEMEQPGTPDGPQGESDDDDDVVARTAGNGTSARGESGLKLIRNGLPPLEVGKNRRNGVGRRRSLPGNGTAGNHHGRRHEGSGRPEGEESGRSDGSSSMETESRSDGEREEHGEHGDDEEEEDEEDEEEEEDYADDEEERVGRSRRRRRRAERGEGGVEDEGEGEEIAPSSPTLVDHRFANCKPIAPYIAAAKGGKEMTAGSGNSRLFYVNDTLYILLRHLQTLYKRLLSAKRNALSQEENKWKKNGSAGVQPADGFRKFLDVLSDLLSGAIDSIKYEDECRALIGTQSYLLFTLDKVVYKLVKQLQLVAADEISSKLLQLQSYERLRSPACFSDEVYRSNACVLLHEEDALYRVESKGKPGGPCDLSIQLMDGAAEKMIVYPTSMDKNFADFFDRYLNKGAVTVDEQRKVVMQRNLTKAKKKSADEGDAVFNLPGLEMKLFCTGLYKMSFVEYTEDIFYRRRKRSVEVEPTAVSGEPAGEQQATDPVDPSTPPVARESKKARAARLQREVRRERFRLWLESTRKR